MRIRAVLACALAVLAAGLPGPIRAGAEVGPDESDESPAGLGSWARLRLEGRKLLIAKGISEIFRWPADEASSDELVVVESSARVLGARAGRHLAAALTAALTDGAGVETKHWFEVSPGKRVRRGVMVGHERYEVSRYPLEDDEDRPAHWVADQSASWMLAAERPRTRLGLYALLGRLGELTASPRGELHVLTKNGPGILRFETRDRRRELWRLTDLDQERRREVTLDVVEVHLLPADDGETLLRMEGETKLWIDADSSALLRIAGRRDGIGGKVQLELTGVGYELDPRPQLAWPPAPSAADDASHSHDAAARPASDRSTHAGERLDVGGEAP
ncbi:MAG: hypothetical protein JSV80_18005 [Acidobacteriota bacterium]|nr:MAG: hypothetical protein JSV80_18005 [Acidobacteriota bacterium]